MDRITLHHRTAAANLPLIELDGLRTRVDLADRLGKLVDEGRARMPFASSPALPWAHPHS